MKELTERVRNESSCTTTLQCLILLQTIIFCAIDETLDDQTGFYYEVKRNILNEIKLK